MRGEEIRKAAEQREGKRHKFEIEEWRVTVWTTPITVADTQHVAQRLKGLDNSEESWAIEMIMLKILDDKGERIWTTEEHRDFLRSKVAKRVLTKIMIKIGMGGGIEEAKKNSKKHRS